MAHVIDMHQLSKDPTNHEASMEKSKGAPSHSMTPFQLSRYLEYCSEMLSVIGKVAAIYGQHFNDSVALAAVNEIEALTTGLSRKIWQKVMLWGDCTSEPVAVDSD